MCASLEIDVDLSWRVRYLFSRNQVSRVGTISANSDKTIGIPEVNTSIISMASAMSRKAPSSFLKGKHSLLSDSLANSLFQGFYRSQFDPDTENVGQTVLHTHHIQKREVFGRVEVGHQIDVGFRSCFATGD